MKSNLPEVMLSGTLYINDSKIDNFLYLIFEHYHNALKVIRGHINYVVDLVGHSSNPQHMTGDWMIFAGV